MRVLGARWWVVGAALLLAALGVAFLLARGEDEHGQLAQRAAQRQAEVVLRESTADVLTRERALAGVIGVLHTAIGDRWPVFARIVTGQPVDFSAGYIQPVTQRDRVVFERRTHLQLFQSPSPGVVRPAGPSAMHYVVTQAVIKGQRPPLGLDLASSPVRVRLLRRAAARDQQVGSPPVALLGVRGHRFGVVVYTPVRKPSGRLVGWISASYRSDQLARLVLDQLPGTRVTIMDGSAFVVHDARRAAGAPGTVLVAGRRWRVWATLDRGPTHTTAWLALALGVVFAVAVALVLRQAATRERYARTMLDQRDLEEAALNQIAVLVAEKAPPEEVFGMVAVQVGELFGARTAAVSRFERATDRGLVVGWWTSEPQDLTGTTFALDGDTASARVFHTARVARTTQTYTEAADFLTPLMARLGAVAGIAAPIHVNTELWGALGAAYSSETIPDGSEARLERFARLVGLAISNADAWGKLAHQAATDPLTGLANRRAFDQQLRIELARAQRYSRQLSLAILDIDHFKQINDHYGHQAGDLVLTRIGELLAHSARDGDLVARIGGEEFAWLMPETSAEGALIAAQRLRARIAQEAFPSAESITISAGIRQTTTDATAESLIRDADLALYDAKHTGRNRAIIHRPSRSDVAVNIAP